MEVALPTCHICQGQMSRGLYEAAEWTCMRCWGMWLASAPGALRWDPVTNEHQSGGELAWPADAEEKPQPVRGWMGDRSGTPYGPSD